MYAYGCRGGEESDEEEGGEWIIEKNSSKGFEWYMKAAEQGHTTSADIKSCSRWQNIN